MASPNTRVPCDPGHNAPYLDLDKERKSSFLGSSLQGSTFPRYKVEPCNVSSLQGSTL
ncbi:MAG: hypothetical protein QNJ47_26840 [Nostocaceae cyanobacterium]|nr:hypothetical protein [Nostocaceae cyanobacterium]